MTRGIFFQVIGDCQEQYQSQREVQPVEEQHRLEASRLRDSFGVGRGKGRDHAIS